MLNLQTSKTVTDMITLIEDTLPDIVEAAEMLAATLDRQFSSRKRNLDPYGLIDDIDLKSAIKLILDARKSPMMNL